MDIHELIKQRQFYKDSMLHYLEILRTNSCMLHGIISQNKTKPNIIDDCVELLETCTKALKEVREESLRLEKHVN